MLPAEAIVGAVGRALVEEFSEYRDHLDINRTLPLKEDEEVPAFIVRQGADLPFNDLSTFDRIGMVLSVSTTIVASGSDEQVIVSALNQFRLRIHRRLTAPGALGLPWVVQVATAGAAEPATDNSGAVVIKELPVQWQIAYTMDRFNPDV